MASPEQLHRSRDIPSSAEASLDSTVSKVDILTRLEQAVGQIQDSETFRRYLDVQARFHKYSWGNVALILAQRPDATRVAGYNTWLKLHRYVRRGEKGMKIIVPMHRKDKVERGEGEEEIDRLFFGTGTVFDVSQTEGEPLLEVDVPVLEGNEAGSLYARLEQLVRAEGLSIRVGGDDLSENTMGLYLPGKREIALRQASSAQMTKTLAHELAHHLALGDLGRTMAEHESIAESVAYVVCGHFGLDTGSRSFPYVALWSRDKAVLKQVLTVVQRVSAKIIDGLESGGETEQTKPEPWRRP